jgi:hypothetical protein
MNKNEKGPFWMLSVLPTALPTALLAALPNCFAERPRRKQVFFLKRGGADYLRPLKEG